MKSRVIFNVTNYNIINNIRQREIMKIFKCVVNSE